MELDLEEEFAAAQEMKLALRQQFKDALVGNGPYDQRQVAVAQSATAYVELTKIQFELIKKRAQKHSNP